VGLSKVRVTAAQLTGVDPSLGDEARLILCLEVVAGCDPMQESERDPIDVVLVIDTSGSMGGVIQQVQEACFQVFTALKDFDRIALVGFCHEAKVLLPLTRKADVLDFTAVRTNIRAGGGTNVEVGLREGLLQLKESSTFASLSRALFGARESASNTGPAMLIVLSDGHPGSGERNGEALAEMLRQLSSQYCPGRDVTVHSLGFTEHHSVALMSALPRGSTGSPGSYYYLGTDADMTASVGDCLGGGCASRPCRDLAFQLSQVNPGESYPTNLQDVCCFGRATADGSSLLALTPLEGSNSTRPPQTLQALERHCEIFVLPPDMRAASLQLTWQSNVGPESLSAQIALEHGFECVSLMNDNGCGEVPEGIEALTVGAHVLRLHVAAALSVLAVGGDDISQRYSGLHNTVLQYLERLEIVAGESAADSDVIFIEGMLQALERDLGEALSSGSRQAGSSAERKGVLLSFAAEHFSMRSASSLSRCRTAYATKQQVEMRLRFLQTSMASGSNVKETCQIEDQEGLTEDELLCRQSAEEQSCFVTLGNWRENVMGLGLFVHPRTLRERRAKLPPQVDLVVDYVSAEAYNLGVRTNIQHAASEGPPVEDSDDEQGAATHVDTRAEVMQSTSRRRINAWLPLYINSTNWSVSRTFAPSAFSLIATQLNAV
jgi:hypothetical protein